MTFDIFRFFNIVYSHLVKWNFESRFLKTCHEKKSNGRNERKTKSICYTRRISKKKRENEIFQIRIFWKVHFSSNVSYYNKINKRIVRIRFFFYWTIKNFCHHNKYTSISEMMMMADADTDDGCELLKIIYVTAWLSFSH